MSKTGINIIAGKYRGKKLCVPNAEGLRPTSNRVRETLFNWLQMEIVGLSTLDLFAGSGLLSFEAISRGAAKATLIEKNRNVFQVLKKNRGYFSNENIMIHQYDALTFIKKNLLTHFQLVFIDPPFASTLCQDALLQLKGKLSPGTLLYIESPTHISTLPFKAECLKQKQAGQVYYALYRTL